MEAACAVSFQNGWLGAFAGGAAQGNGKDVRCQMSEFRIQTAQVPGGANSEFCILTSDI